MCGVGNFLLSRSTLPALASLLHLCKHPPQISVRSLCGSRVGPLYLEVLGSRRVLGDDDGKRPATVGREGGKWTPGFNALTDEEGAFSPSAHLSGSSRASGCVFQRARACPLASHARVALRWKRLKGCFYLRRCVCLISSVCFQSARLMSTDWVGSLRPSSPFAPPFSTVQTVNVP